MITLFRILNILALILLAYFIYELWHRSKSIEKEQTVQKNATAQQDVPDFQALLDRLQMLENNRVTIPSITAEKLAMLNDLEARMQYVELVIKNTFTEIL
jgi:hypothetical protein